MTFYIRFGRNKGWWLRGKKGEGYELILGWVSIALLFYDLDSAIDEMATRAKELEASMRELYTITTGTSYEGTK